MKKFKNIIFLFLLAAILIIPPFSVSAGKKEVIKDSQGKEIFEFHLPGNLSIIQNSDGMYNPNNSYTVIDSQTKEEFGILEFDCDPNEIIEMDLGDKNSIYTEHKTTNNLAYFSVRDKGDTIDNEFVAMDKDGHIIVFYEFYSNHGMEETIINSIKPIKGDKFEDLGVPVQEAIQKQNAKDSISSLLLSLLLSWFVLSIGKFGMFPKMGIAKYKAWIPLYSDYLMCLKVWNKKGFWLLYPLLILLNIISGVQDMIPVNSSMGDFFFPAGVVIALPLLIIMLTYCSWLSYSFGKKDGVVALLFFLQPIGYIYLGYSKAQYIGNAYEQNNGELKEARKNNQIKEE